MAFFADWKIMIFFLLCIYTISFFANEIERTLKDFPIEISNEIKEKCYSAFISDPFLDWMKNQVKKQFCVNDWYKIKDNSFRITNNEVSFLTYFLRTLLYVNRISYRKIFPIYVSYLEILKDRSCTICKSSLEDRHVKEYGKQAACNRFACYKMTDLLVEILDDKCNVSEGHEYNVLLDVCAYADAHGRKYDYKKISCGYIGDCLTPILYLENRNTDNKTIEKKLCFLQRIIRFLPQGFGYGISATAINVAKRETLSKLFFIENFMIERILLEINYYCDEKSGNVKILYDDFFKIQHCSSVEK